MNSFLNNGVTAHRGNSGEFPENTLAAIRSAAALGADWIEIDVLATRDGVLVASHDTTTGRAGDRDLEIARSTYAELLAVDAAAGFRRVRGLPPGACAAAQIPTLVELLAFIRTQGRTRLSLQPKGDVLDAVFALIDDLGAAPLVGFNDGSLEFMRRVKARNPATPVFWDRHDYADEAALDRDIATAVAHGFEALVLRRDTVTAGRAARIRAAGLEAGAWTVNDADEMRRLRDLGIGRLYTDYPAVALGLLKPA